MWTSPPKREGSGGARSSEGERKVPRGPAAPVLTGALLCLLLPAPTPSPLVLHVRARQVVEVVEEKEVTFLFLP